MGDIDLYGDLEVSPVVISDGEEAPTDNSSFNRMRRGDTGDEGEEVRALLKLLQAAEFGPSDDEMEDGVNIATSADNDDQVGLFADPDDMLLQVDEDVLPSAKRPCVNEGIHAEVRNVTVPTEASDDAFDFEADIPAGPAEPERRPVLPASGSRYRGSQGALATVAAPQPGYAYNQSTGRWENGLKFAQEARNGDENVWRSYGKGGRSKGSGKGLDCEYKARLCRNFAHGACRYAERCSFAHGEDELCGSGLEMLRLRCIAQCISEARRDAKSSLCEYPQALVVRLAARFERRPDEILSSMARAGLPVGTDRRTTVKALLRLCHPDKCHHPDAKQAVQILGPLLGT